MAVLAYLSASFRGTAHDDTGACRKAIVGARSWKPWPACSAWKPESRNYSSKRIGQQTHGLGAATSDSRRREHLREYYVISLIPSAHCIGPVRRLFSSLTEALTERLSPEVGRLLRWPARSS